METQTKAIILVCEGIILSGRYYLEKPGSVHLGYESPAIRFKALARTSPTGFTLLSGLGGKGFLNYKKGKASATSSATALR